MMEEHQPTAEFVDHLEWQLRTSLARGSRFSVPVRSTKGGKMKIAALVLVSALFGAGGVVANDELQEARAQEVLVARVQADIELASLELQINMQQLQEVEERYSAGIVGEEELRFARVGSREAETRLASLQLDLEEIQATGKAPNSALSAPKIRGRDYVSERLALQESVASERYSLAQLRLSRAQQLLEIGAVSAEEHSQALVALLEAKFELERNRERMQARQGVTDGLIGEDEAERQIEIFETEKRIELLRVGLQEAAISLQRVDDLVKAGAAHESKRQKVQLQVLRKDRELEFLEMKLAGLRGGEI